MITKNMDLDMLVNIGSDKGKGGDQKMELDTYFVVEYLKAKQNMHDEIEKICQNIELNHKKILLFNLPADANLGDHAQTVCIVEFLKEKYLDYDVYTFPTFTKSTYNDLFSAISRLTYFVSDEDIIVFHSGYHINDIYCNEYFEMSPTTMIQLVALELFKNNKCIFFPQTINMSHEHLKKYASIIEKHSNAVIMCRDIFSRNLVRPYFATTELLIIPDIVTTWIGTYKKSYKLDDHKKAYIAIRDQNQKESIISDKQIELICNTLKEKGFEVTLGSTLIDESYETIKKNTKKIVMDKINEIAGYDVVVTDLYHGTIFSLIAGTLVVVLPGSDHKIKSGVDFFREIDEFENRFYYDDNINNTIGFLSRLQKEDMDIGDNESMYFKEKFFNQIII